MVSPENPLLHGTGYLPVPRRVKHVKSGGTYRIIVQARIEHDQSDVVVYQSKQHGTVWVRPTAEFCDGRFVAIDQ